MNLTWLIDSIGENWTLVAGGVVIGALFGAFAQQSRFCLRSAVIEFSRGTVGANTLVWLLVFTTAIAGTQILAMLDLIVPWEARQLASPQSISGAAIGGLMFGSGMILARGCASRLLVLSATGNLRALLSGLVFAVVAQASLRGSLAPAREAIAGLLTTRASGGNDLLAMGRIGGATAIWLAVMPLVVTLVFAVIMRLDRRRLISAVMVGLAIPLAWAFTGMMARVAFEPVQLEAITFTGPSADTLMLFLSPPGELLEFDVGLVPGVFLGAFLAGLATRQLKLQGFEGGQSMKRYLAGAFLMGFGGMLAGGCAVGAGVTGASVFALTAWITLFSIWLAAGVTDWIVDRR